MRPRVPLVRPAAPAAPALPGAVRAAGFPAALLAALALLPLVLPYMALAAQVLVYALFSLGYDLAYGRTGLLSFGHAAFFGLGAYGAALAGRATRGDLLPALGAAVACAGAGAAVIGFLSLRRRGVYFALLTLAFAQLLYFVALEWRALTGGDNGLRGIPPMSLRLGGTVLAAFGSSRAVYGLAAAALWLCVLLVRRLHASPLGHALAAVRENEVRAEACGYNTSALKLWAFTLSGGLCGLAGALNTLLLSFVGLDVLSWLTSGFVLLMTILGGAGTLLGPLVGAGVFLALQDLVSTVPAVADSWPLFVGIVLIAVVLLFPGGICGTLEGLVRRPRQSAPDAHRGPLAPARGGARAPAAAVRVESLAKRFGGLAAVDGVSLRVEPGEVRGVIGPNGAGKTTLLRLISGEIAPAAGRIYVGDEDVTGWPLFRVARAGVAKSFQITSIFPNLSAFDNARAAVLARHNPYAFWRRADEPGDLADLAEEALARVHLAGKRDVPAYALSHGEQRHLEVAIALACRPRVLLLDEPTAGMSPEETRKTMALIRDLASGLTVVVVEHKMEVVMTVCDRVTVLSFGRVIADGTPEEVRRLEVVQAAYLGRPQAGGHAP
jgi:branched-chain amino acid transport system permease protein